MRRLIAICIGFSLSGAAAHADQRDSRLDALFTGLVQGDPALVEPAIAAIQEIWADAPSDTADLLYARAFDAAASGAHDVALALCDHVVAMNPNFAQGYALRGVVRRAVGDLSGAIEDFESALRLERRHFEARVALGEIYLDLRDKKRALAMFESALVWNPHDAVAGAHVRRLRFELQGEET